MYASSIPTRFEPAKPPSRPNIKIKADAIPRNLVGNKFTETAIIMPAQLQQLRNTAKLNTIALNSVKKFKATHVIADIINQMPKMKRIISSFINLQCMNLKHITAYKWLFYVEICSATSSPPCLISGKICSPPAIFHMIKYFCYLNSRTWNARRVH